MSVKHAPTIICAITVLALAIDNVVIKVREHNRDITKNWRMSRELSQGVYPLPHHIFFFTDGSDEVDILARQSGWAPRIYNVSSAQTYIDQNCSFASAAYKRVVPIAAKADIFRLCAMLAEGGLYLDDDLFPVVSLDLFAFADKNGLLLVEDYAATGYWGSRDSNSISVWQAFIGSAWPGHPFFQCALRTVVENVLTHTTERKVLFITGPHALRVCTKNYMFRFQLHANGPNVIAKNKSHVVIVHKAFPARAGRDRHYSKYASSELVLK